MTKSFIEKYPEYSETKKLDQLRSKQYSRLDGNGHVYLDYTGAGIYAKSQLKEHFQLLEAEVFGNPHSYNPTSIKATELVEGTRAYILNFFHASNEEYVCIFTANASSALKLIGEAYPFGNGCRYLLTFDNHNSVNGIREYAGAKGADVTYLPVVLPDLRVDEPKLINELNELDCSCFNLFAYPAQSNFSGVQHPLNWIKTARDLGWDVLLDAAAFVPTNLLDLSTHHPDFVPVSFYKIFGYPTGVGALIARKETLSKLSRSWFAGGTTAVASVRGNKYYPADPPFKFEDGTVNFLNIPAVEIGLRYIDSIGFENIHTRINCLTGYLLEQIQALDHSNGQSLVQIYGPLMAKNRGGAIALNFFDKDGKIISKDLLEKEANRRNISIRMGFFCNPGAGEVALNISTDELATCFTKPAFTERISDLDFQRCIDPKASGAVRVSLGLMSNLADVEAFLDFARFFLN